MKTLPLVALLVSAATLAALPAATAHNHLVATAACTEGWPDACVARNHDGCDVWLESSVTDQCVVAPPAGLCLDGAQVVGDACTIDVPRAPEDVCIEGRRLLGGPCDINVDVPWLVQCSGDRYALHVDQMQTQCFGIPLP